MRNASRMARYMMMRTGREAERDYRRDYDVRSEGGNYARDNYGMDNRFRDRRGREHYDNGRFAPRNDMGDMGGDYYGPYGRSIDPGKDYGGEDRRGREGVVRNRYDRGTRRNWDDEEDGMGMNMIGFDRPQEVTNHYPTRVDYEQRNEMEHRSGHKMAGGAMGAGAVFNEEIAKEWTKKMHNEDGSKGEHWNMDQVKKLMTQRGVEYNLAEVYAVINALYSDYCKVFKKYGFNSPEAYLDLALAWLNDSDAVDDKAMMYYECIVKH